jgi:hypothetical protein
MPKKPVALPDGQFWSSCGEAEDHFRAVRDRYPLNVPIDGPADHADLCSLLERYDMAIVDGPSKIGPGVRHFEVRVNRTNGGPTRGFWVVRTDGSETDFSFIRAVSATPKPQAQQFSDACRSAVHLDVQAAKFDTFSKFADEDGKVPCEVTSELVAKSEARIDYVGRSFGQIVQTFRSVEGWREAIPGGILTLPDDAQTTSKFADGAAADRFREFHHAAATLRIVAKSVTRSQSASSATILRPVKL